MDYLCKRSHLAGSLKQTQKSYHVVLVSFETFEIHFESLFVIGSLLGDHPQSGISLGTGSIQPTGNSKGYLSIVEVVLLQRYDSKPNVGARLIGCQVRYFLIAQFCLGIIFN